MLSAVFVASVVAASSGLAQAGGPAGELPVAGYMLRPSSEGGYSYEGDRFVAKIAPDGRVTFSDRHVRLEGGGLVGATRDEGAVAGSESELLPEAELAPPRMIGNPVASRPGDVGPPPSDRFPPVDAPSARLLPLLPPLASGVLRFDATDEFVRGRGDDPSAREKADFCSATFEFRAALARQSQMATTRLALQRLPGELERIWSDPRLSTAERRAVVFALRQETSDSPEGRAARTIIDDFIRMRLPSGNVR